MSKETVEKMSLPNKVKRRVIAGTPLKGNLESAHIGDPWAEAQFFGAGEGSEFVTGVQPGDVISCIYDSIKIGNLDQAASKQRPYARLTLLNKDGSPGDLVRLFAPGGLRTTLEALEKGTRMEISYRGMEWVEKLESNCHQYDVMLRKEDREKLN